MDRWHLNHTEMAVLSGCETGCDRSIDDAVDEYLGLDAAIHIAGARTVVSTLWPVTEDVAGVTSILLLIGVLFQHRSPGEALRQAQLALVSGQWRAFLTEVYTEVRDGKPRSGAGAEPVLERLLDLAPDSFTDVMDFAAYRSYGA
jgi:CHAT domain-containing protein